jgi:hypothetical protein
MKTAGWDICPWDEFAWQFLGLRISPRGGGPAFILTWAVALLDNPDTAGTRLRQVLVSLGGNALKIYGKGRGGRGGLKPAASIREIPQDNTDLRLLEAEKFEGEESDTPPVRSSRYRPRHSHGLYGPTFLASKPGGCLGATLDEHLVCGTDAARAESEGLEYRGPKIPLVAPEPIQILL